jgi:hypothetical protein
VGREPQPSLIYAIGPSNKKYRLDGSTIHLKSDAIIVNGAIEGMKHHGEGYGFQEIGDDLLSLVQESAHYTVRLVNAVSGNTDNAAVEAVAALGVPDNDYLPAAGNLLEQGGSEAPPPISEDISALYCHAFQSMNKSIFLLTQWKSSWDSTMSAVATDDTVAEDSLAEAVASAAAVVAAATPSTKPVAAPATDGGPDQNNPNLVSLLLAADKSSDSVSDVAAAVAEHVQDQVDWQLQQEGQAHSAQQGAVGGDPGDDALDDVCEYPV